MADLSHAGHNGFVLGFIRLARQQRLRVGGVSLPNQFKRMIFHGHQFGIGRVRLGHGLAGSRFRNQTHEVFERLLQLRLKPAVTDLPLRIAGGRRHADGRGQDFVEKKDLAHECLDTDDSRQMRSGKMVAAENRPDQPSEGQERDRHGQREQTQELAFDGRERGFNHSK